MVLDYIKGIKVDINNLPIDNLQALEYLRDGIFHLAGIIETKEESHKKESEVGVNGFVPGKSTVFYWSNSNPGHNLILNQFNWFAVSCVNYIRVVGLVDIMNKNGWKSADIKDHIKEIKDHCDQYISEVASELVWWRNKISAHPSATDPRKKDNLSLLEFSLMNQLTFESPHYFVGSLNWSNGEGSSDSKRWSLVKVFKEKLIPRYWPDVRVDKA
jgi:hypothetical protein